MPDTIYLPVELTNANVVRIGDDCYERVGEDSRPPDVGEIDEEFSDCQTCIGVSARIVFNSDLCTTCVDTSGNTSSMQMDGTTANALSGVYFLGRFTSENPGQYLWDVSFDTSIPYVFDSVASGCRFADETANFTKFRVTMHINKITLECTYLILYLYNPDSTYGAIRNPGNYKVFQNLSPNVTEGITINDKLAGCVNAALSEGASGSATVVFYLD
ncbi:MAG: hypothetical protein MI741_18445 [Rhodospirillales bacterium]|nr:hypothetical protein [Rhodospirillales bacterium]